MKILIPLLILCCSLAAGAARSKDERKTLFKQATERLKGSGIEDQIPKKGDLFPNLSLGGKKISQYLDEGSLVLTFYRGGWCPYCVSQLKELNGRLVSLHQKDAILVAISPETEQEVRKTKNKNDLKFLLLSDKDNEIARKLGLVYKLEDEVATEYKNLGISLSANQGNSRNELPIPATFVIGKDRKVRYVFADADYTKRASIDEILGALK